MRLDDLRPESRGGALDHVRVERPLGEELDRSVLPGLLFEHGDEFRADDLAFPFGIGDAFELLEEALARVDHGELELALLAELARHLFGLALAQQTVVHQHALEPAADRPMAQGGHHGAVDAARETAQNVAVSDLRANVRDGPPQEPLHAPPALELRDAEQEVWMTRLPNGE
jgi:hypothetical protein